MRRSGFASDGTTGCSMLYADRLAGTSTLPPAGMPRRDGCRPDAMSGIGAEGCKGSAEAEGVPAGATAAESSLMSSGVGVRSSTSSNTVPSVSSDADEPPFNIDCASHRACCSHEACCCLRFATSVAVKQPLPIKSALPSVTSRLLLPPSSLPPPPATSTAGIGGGSTLGGGRRR